MELLHIFTTRLPGDIVDLMRVGTELLGNVCQDIVCNVPDVIMSCGNDTIIPGLVCGDALVFLQTLW